MLAAVGKSGIVILPDGHRRKEVGKSEVSPGKSSEDQVSKVL